MNNFFNIIFFCSNHYIISSHNISLNCFSRMNIRIRYCNKSTQMKNYINIICCMTNRGRIASSLSPAGFMPERAW